MATTRLLADPELLVKSAGIDVKELATTLFTKKSLSEEQRKYVIENFGYRLDAVRICRLFARERTEYKYASRFYRPKKVTVWGSEIDQEWVGLSDELFNQLILKIGNGGHKMALQAFPERLSLDTLATIGASSHSTIVRKQIMDIMKERVEFQEFAKNFGFLSLSSDTMGVVAQEKLYKEFLRRNRIKENSRTSGIG